MSRPDRDDLERGLQAARAILAMRWGSRRTSTNRNAVACPHCGAARWEPCIGPASGRPMPAVHPSRADAAALRDDHLDRELP